VEFIDRVTGTVKDLLDKGVLDSTATTMYVRGLMENLSPIAPLTATELALPKEKEDVLREIAVNKIKKGGTGLTYSDYLPKEEATPLSYKAPIADLTDPREDMRMTFGRADLTRDEDGNIYVEDTYNFDPKNKADKTAPTLDKLLMAADAIKSDMSTYGKAHRIGELFVKDIPMKINLGNAADLGISEKELSRLPMYRGYEEEVTVDRDKSMAEQFGSSLKDLFG